VRLTSSNGNSDTATSGIRSIYLQGIDNAEIIEAAMLAGSQ
jgi:hypothetical protein